MNTALKLLTPWHKADIKAALEKAGYTFKRLDRETGYRNTRDVLRYTWRGIEQRIGQIIGVDPAYIWPARYPEGPGIHPPKRINKNTLQAARRGRNG